MRGVGLVPACDGLHPAHLSWEAQTPAGVSASGRACPSVSAVSAQHPPVYPWPQLPLPPTTLLAQPRPRPPSDSQMIRDVFAKHSGKAPPAPPADVPSKAYGAVSLNETALLADNLGVLAKPVASELPSIMEDYAQGCALT